MLIRHHVCSRTITSFKCKGNKSILRETYVKIPQFELCNRSNCACITIVIYYDSHTYHFQVTLTNFIYQTNGAEPQAVFMLQEISKSFQAVYIYFLNCQKLLSSWSSSSRNRAHNEHIIIQVYWKDETFNYFQQFLFWSVRITWKMLYQYILKLTRPS